MDIRANVRRMSDIGAYLQSGRGWHGKIAMSICEREGFVKKKPGAHALRVDGFLCGTVPNTVEG
jgi:hypothetical protein